MELNVNFNTKTPDYAMFTDLGNATVHALVESARANHMTWAQTYRALCDLARYPEFGEATDTAVREMVYDALGVEDENFYL
jgi:hypothetical protein